MLDLTYDNVTVIYLVLYFLNYNILNLWNFFHCFSNNLHFFCLDFLRYKYVFQSIYLDRFFFAVNLNLFLLVLFDVKDFWCCLKYFRILYFFFCCRYIEPMNHVVVESYFFHCYGIDLNIFYLYVYAIRHHVVDNEYWNFLDSNSVNFQFFL